MLNFKLIYDGEFIGNYDVCFEINRYVERDRLALSLWGADYECWEPFGDVTVNLPFANITDENCGYLDVNNMPSIVDFLIENKLGELTGRTAISGWVKYPEFRFNMEEIKKHSSFEPTSIEDLRKRYFDGEYTIEMCAEELYKHGAINNNSIEEALNYLGLEPEE